MVGRTPVTRWLDRLVRARYLRIIPVEFRHTFFLRVEILGCRGGEGGYWIHNQITAKWSKYTNPLNHVLYIGINMKPFLLLLLEMSWWPPAVWPRLPLVGGKRLCRAVNQASLRASRATSVSLSLCSVMVDRIARTTLMRSTVVRAQLCLVICNFDLFWVILPHQSLVSLCIKVSKYN